MMLSPFWMIYLTIMAFLFGACVGSFLNVCIHRIPLDESVVAPRSHCPRCGKLIAWYDNIPLFSFFVLRAKCRHCGASISARYFLVELLTAMLFLMVWNRYGFDVRTPIYWLFVGGLILGTFVDFSHMIIPDRVTLGGMLAGVVLSVAFPALHGKEVWAEGLKTSLVGLVCGSGLLLGVAYLGKLAFKKDAMGLGDVKLLGAIGAFLGWRAVLFTIMMSSVLGSVVGVYLITSQKKEWQSRIPYGPYIALAAIIWILGGDTWWQMYINWLTVK